MTNKEEFKKLFLKVKKMEFVKSNRKGNTGIGKTFEDCFGLEENNLPTADFKGIELKSQRELSSSYLTLFTKSPSLPRLANTKLRLKFGTPDKEHPDIEVLHTSIFSQNFNTHTSGYGFKLQVNKNEEKIYILVKNLETQEIINTQICWTFGALKRKIEEKLNMIAYISAETKIERGNEYFYFNKATLLSGLTFEKFIFLLEQGKVMVDIRIGAYKTGKNKGKTHDHGTGFRINKEDLEEFFDIEIIE